jgi:acetyl-CoA acetyltransferase
MTFVHDLPSRLQPCIVGVGETAYTRRGGHNDTPELKLCIQAIRAAAADASIDPREIEGFSSFGFERHEPAVVQTALAAPLLRYAAMVWGGGGGGCSGAVMLAAMAVATGQARYAVVYRSICQGQHERYGQFRDRPLWGSYVGPYGLMSPGMMVALGYRRFMYESGGTPDDLCEVAMNSRSNAQFNPRAVMYGKPLTRESYFDSRMVADPFRLNDYCLETDGACAVIIAPREVAERLQRPPVPILGAAMASGPRWSLGPMGSHNMPLESYATINSKDVARDVYAQAGITPGDIDVAQIYDAFSGLIPMALEDYGLCGKGETSAFIQTGALRRGGKLPINTAGGLHSEAYLHGLNLVVEGVRQARGDAVLQTPNVRHCLVTSGGGTGQKSALVLGGV